MTSHDIDLHDDNDLALAFQRFRSSIALLRVRVRMGIVLEGLSLVLVALAVYFCATWPIDRWFRLSIAVRAVVLALGAGWLLWRLSMRVLRPLMHDLDDEELALAVERSNEPLGQRLISAIQFHERIEKRDFAGESAVMMREVVHGLPDALGSVRINEALRGDRVRKSALAAALAATFLVLVGAFYSGFGLWAKRNLLLSDQDWPRETLLSVVGAGDGKSIVVPRGDDFTIEVAAGGVVPETVRIEYWYENGSSGVETMTQNVGEATFSYTFPGLLDPVQFYAWGGDGETPEVTIRLVDRPVLESTKIRTLYPKYMQRDPQDIAADVTELLVPRGTVLAVEGVATKALRRAELAIGEHQTAAATVGPDKTSVRGEIRPEASGILEVRLLDEDGLTQGEGRRVMLRVVPDKAPRLGAKLRGLGSWITPKARIPVDLTVSDDFGLERISMFWSVGESAAIGAAKNVEQDFKVAKASGLEEFEPGSLTFERLVRHDLLPLVKNPDEPMSADNPVRPGHFVAVVFRAWDNNRKDSPDGQWASSDSYTFKVVSESDLLRELKRRQSELREQFEKIHARQKAGKALVAELEDPKAPGALGARVRNRLQQLARQERALSKRVVEIGRRYGDILDEMLNNRVAEGVGGEGRVRALRSVIVAGLENLGKSAMPNLAASIGKFGRDGSLALRDQVENGYTLTIRQMARILREMLRLESFTEVLTQLKDLIRIEDSTLQEAKKRLEKELQELFPGKDRGRDEAAGKKDR